MNKILVVYNPCGISGKDNSNYYIQALHTILSQNNFKDFDVAVSSCLNTLACKNKILQEFGNNIIYNDIKDKLPVNITFNHTVKKCVEKYGEYEAYIYVDSGIQFTSDTIEILWNTYKSGPYSMVSALADNDNATEFIFGWYRPTEDVVIPVGKSINLHVQLFCNDIFKAYNAILPDIFASFCSESTLSFISASVLKKWIISHKLYLLHEKSLDGASSGFYPTNIIPHWHLFASRRPMQEIISDREAYECGFGYEECNQIMTHNPSVYDNDDMPNDPQRLRNFIKENIFLQPDVFDYNNINYELNGKYE